MGGGTVDQTPQVAYFDWTFTAPQALHYILWRQLIAYKRGENCVWVVDAPTIRHHRHAERARRGHDSQRDHGAGRTASTIYPATTGDATASY